MVGNAVGILCFTFIEAVVVTPEGSNSQLGSAAPRAPGVASYLEVPVQIRGPGTRPSDLLPPEPPGDGGVGDGGG